MELLILIIDIAVLTTIGWNILYLINYKGYALYVPEWLSLSYGLGVGFVSLEMLVLYFFKLEFSPVGIITPWIALVFLNLVLSHKRGGIVAVGNDAGKKEKLGWLGMALVAGISFETFYAFFRALIKPIESYDAVAIYAIKSKIFYLAGAIREYFFTDLVKLFPHPDYPPNIPLAEAFIYLGLGNLNDQLVKVIFPLYFVAILAVLYYAVRRVATRTYALLSTFILASIPQFNAYAANAYLDLPLAFYCFVSLLFLMRWFGQTEKPQLLVVSSVMAALAAWTKNEGLMYCIVNFALLAIFLILNRKKISRKCFLYPVMYVAIILTILAPWLYLKYKYGIANSEIDLKNLSPIYLLGQVKKLGPVLYEFQKQFFGPKKWNILWPILAVAIAFNFKKAFSGIQKYLAMSIALTVCGYIVFYMISYVDVVFFVTKTWSRFLLHFLPIVVYWLALILKEDPALPGAGKDPKGRAG